MHIIGYLVAAALGFCMGFLVFALVSINKDDK